MCLCRSGRDTQRRQTKPTTSENLEEWKNKTRPSSISYPRCFFHRFDLFMSNLRCRQTVLPLRTTEQTTSQVKVCFTIPTANVLFTEKSPSESPTNLSRKIHKSATTGNRTCDNHHVGDSLILLFTQGMSTAEPRHEMTRTGKLWKKPGAPVLVRAHRGRIPDKISKEVLHRPRDDHP